MADPASERLLKEAKFVNGQIAQRTAGDYFLMHMGLTYPGDPFRRSPTAASSGARALGASSASSMALGRAEATGGSLVSLRPGGPGSITGRSGSSTGRHSCPVLCPPPSPSPSRASTVDERTRRPMDPMFHHLMFGPPIFSPQLQKAVGLGTKPQYR
eukprot:TRINITY_DN62852_c0_g1_i1.p1 TRINITY_DN62852_c0_g1~~TRINITY_DN62852_c0_g1_i1.p1  ORF type:complete len:157 (-),score=16.79 TRINITY_DN62852_c0_g1_i1:17-487(-)